MLESPKSTENQPSRAGRSGSRDPGERSVIQHDALVGDFMQPNRRRFGSRLAARACALVLVLGVVATFGTGCTPVAPYERGKLAHPTMTAADLAGMGEQHLRAIDEGATGGSAGTGSGCGCN